MGGEVSLGGRNRSKPIGVSLRMPGEKQMKLGRYGGKKERRQ